MNRKSPPATDTRAFADKAQQTAHDLHRTVESLKEIADDLKGAYALVSPVVDWLKSKQACPPAKVQVLVSALQVLVSSKGRR